MATIDEAVAQVKDAIEKHATFGAGQFSPAVLKTVLSELNRMKSSATFAPTYPRFILDWEDVSGSLGKVLVEVAYQRQQSLKRR
ncbi:MAG: hypothetical protein A2885_16965 [Sphingopyxis sp. RIFCSPHIGHO2_01_FULL_65_24]|nr:MAG: hypothetical protein A2885_16965 [Sphingopyxis sp. RIFCSPHIGHO2_01_FULL_65_24]